MKLLGHECQGDATFSHNLNICHVEKKKWHISISKAEKIRDKREYAQCSPETGDPSHMTQTDTPELSTVEEKVNKKNSELDECPPDWWAPQTGQPQQWAATWPSARPRSSVSNLHFLQLCSRWSAPYSAPPPGLVQRILSPVQLMMLHNVTATSRSHLLHLLETWNESLFINSPCSTS